MGKMQRRGYSGPPRYEKREGRSNRSEPRDEWIYGINPVFEAIRSGREIKTVYLSLSRNEKALEIEKEVLSRGLKVQKADNIFFDSKFPKGHQNIAAVVSPRKYADIEELLELPEKKGGQPLFLVLDQVEDTRNFGAILRVADAGGVHGVVIQSHRSAHLTPEAVKASAGASEYVPVAVVPNIKHAMKAMRDSGVTIIGAEADIGTNIWEVDLNRPLALVVGSEGKGLRKTVKEDCDVLVSIPMQGMVNSLNASVAAGIVIFEIMRQRTLELTISSKNKSI